MNLGFAYLEEALPGRSYCAVSHCCQAVPTINTPNPQPRTGHQHLPQVPSPHSSHCRPHTSLCPPHTPHHSTPNHPIWLVLLYDSQTPRCSFPTLLIPRSPSYRPPFPQHCQGLGQPGRLHIHTAVNHPLQFMLSFLGGAAWSPFQLGILHGCDFSPTAGLGATITEPTIEPFELEGTSEGHAAQLPCSAKGQCELGLWGGARSLLTVWERFCFGVHRDIAFWVGVSLSAQRLFVRRAPSAEPTRRFCHSAHSKGAVFFFFFFSFFFFFLFPSRKSIFNYQEDWMNGGLPVHRFRTVLPQTTDQPPTSVLRPQPGIKQVNTLQYICYKLTVTSKQINRLWA